MLGVILRGFFIAFCPGQVAVVVPAHAYTVQAFNLLPCQASGTLAAANLPLNLQPCAKAQAHGRLVAPRNVQVAVFGMVNAGLGEVVVPGRRQTALQLFEQHAAVMDLLHNLKTVSHNLITLTVGVETLHGGSHLILQAADAGQSLKVIDDIQNKRCRAIPCCQSTTNLLFVDNRRNRRAEQNNTRDTLNMDPLIEHVNAEQEF